MFNNPEMMQSMMGMMQNPEFMNSMMGMMQNPEIQKMMQDPNTLKNLGNFMNNNASENKNEDDTENVLNTYTNESKILLTGLNNEEYNKKEGIIKGYDTTKKRYLVYIADIDKQISVKEENCIEVLNSDSDTDLVTDSGSDSEIEQVEN